jgi:hypothetical protein
MCNSLSDIHASLAQLIDKYSKLEPSNYEFDIFDIQDDPFWGDEYDNLDSPAPFDFPEDDLTPQEKAELAAECAERLQASDDEYFTKYVRPVCSAHGEFDPNLDEGNCPVCSAQASDWQATGGF